MGSFSIVITLIYRWIDPLSLQTGRRDDVAVARNALYLDHAKYWVRKWDNIIVYVSCEKHNVINRGASDTKTYVLKTEEKASFLGAQPTTTTYIHVDVCRKRNNIFTSVDMYLGN